MIKQHNSIILERRFVPEGTTIMREGEKADCAYLIQSGQASVYSDHDGKKIELAKLEQGQIFGEAALIFNAPRTASVDALDDMNLIVITRQTLEHKLNQSDPTIRALVEMLINRVVSVNNTILGSQSDSDDLLDTGKIIYENVLAALPEDQKDDFQKQVLPKLDGFLDAVRTFPAAKS